MRPFHQAALLAGKAITEPHSPLASRAQHYTLPHPPLRVELRRPGDLTQHERRRWAELSTRAAPGNIFAADWFMEPALRHCAAAWTLRLAIVRGLTGDWVGVLPVTLKASIGRSTIASWHSWHAAEPSLGTPLVLPGAEKAFWRALLAHLDQRPGIALGLSCGAMPDDLAVTQALASLCAEQGRMLHHLDSFIRPARRGVALAYQGSAIIEVVCQLDQELDQQEAGLAEALGPVNLVLHDCAEDCEPWLGAFFALERAGSKRQVAAPATTAMFREVVRNACRRGVARLASLRAGEQIVAMTCWLTAGRYSYGLRMAHDEAWARFAPDRLLTRRVVRMANAEPLVLFDSCAPAGTQRDPFWPDQREIGAFAVGIGSAPRRKLFDALMRRSKR
jgi:CelD/BcsL family acetyltransferase involved in cellulose biosynthesis